MMAGVALAKEDSAQASTAEEAKVVAYRLDVGGNNMLQHSRTARSHARHSVSRLTPTDNTKNSQLSRSRLSSFQVSVVVLFLVAISLADAKANRSGCPPGTCSRTIGRL